VPEFETAPVQVNALATALSPALKLVTDLAVFERFPQWLIDPSTKSSGQSFHGTQ
jgi:hypothetical protein